MNKLKAFLTVQNLMLVLLVGVAGHNYYLQLQVKKVLEVASEARDEANEAAHLAGYASSAAESAAQYAESAVDIAGEARDYAYEASENAYGNVCGYCP